MLIPPMLLQPVVENAIKFGLYDTTDAVTINISVFAENESLKVIVQNPFDPETASPRHGTGFGLNSSKTKTLSIICKNGSRGNFGKRSCIYDNHKYSKT